MKHASWLVAVGLFATSLDAQGVMVAPHAVYIDHRVRSGSVLLYNPGTEPVEVTISTFFGYPVTDSTGTIMLRTVEAPDSTQPSALAWVQAFPRRLTVAPLERQTVRLLGRPPAALADGEYWLRLVIAAKGGQVPVTGIPDSSGIQVGLTLEVRTVIGVAYRKGAVSTGVALSNVRAQLKGDTLFTWGRLERRGNAAFVGVVRGTLVDSTRAVRASFTSPLGVYFTMEPRIAVVVGRLPRGRYWLRYEVAAEREDLDPAVVLKAPTVRDSVQLVVP
ncbi:MAG TPA: hypothetical protein VN908_07465 [Gemmatimonadales bacterium]|nr:hypothetical protein [Gemmatimonadales bacterium]